MKKLFFILIVGLTLVSCTEIHYRLRGVSDNALIITKQDRIVGYEVGDTVTVSYRYNWWINKRTDVINDTIIRGRLDDGTAYAILYKRAIIENIYYQDE